MFLRTEIIKEKKLVGKKLRMSFADNKTFELWKSFMPERKNIHNTIGSELYSLEVYDENFFRTFSVSNEFDKYAMMEVGDFSEVPEGIITLLVPSGLYAVFLHRGPAVEAAATYQYIFQSWLPGSGFKLDNRPHFAVMGNKYKQESPDSEEEIFIPIK